MPPTQTLRCTNGAHPWNRTPSRGRPPRHCPEHPKPVPRELAPGDSDRGHDAEWLLATDTPDAVNITERQATVCRAAYAFTDDATEALLLAVDLRPGDPQPDLALSAVFGRSRAGIQRDRTSALATMRAKSTSVRTREGGEPGAHEKWNRDYAMESRRQRNAGWVQQPAYRGHAPGHPRGHRPAPDHDFDVVDVGRSPGDRPMEKDLHTHPRGEARPETCAICFLQAHAELPEHTLPIGRGTIHALVA